MYKKIIQEGDIKVHLEINIRSPRNLNSSTIKTEVTIDAIYDPSPILRYHAFKVLDEMEDLEFVIAELEELALKNLKSTEVSFQDKVLDQLGYSKVK